MKLTKRIERELLSIYEDGLAKKFGFTPTASVKAMILEAVEEADGDEAKAFADAVTENYSHQFGPVENKEMEEFIKEELKNVGKPVMVVVEPAKVDADTGEVIVPAKVKERGQDDSQAQYESEPKYKAVEPKPKKEKEETVDKK